MEPPTGVSSLPIIVFFIALAFRALFSFLETSITALRLFKLKELASSTNKYKLLFQTLEKSPHRVLITILIANSLADVTTAALATHIMENFFRYIHLPSGLGFSLGIGIATIAILIFGEIIPKNIAKCRGEKIFKSFLWLINTIFYFFHPIVSFLIRFSDFVVAKFLGKEAFECGAEWVSSEREVQFLIRYMSEKGLIESEKTEMLQSIFDLGSTPVKEIMVPATDIVSVNANASSNDILGIYLQRHFTRLPVYEGKADNIIGMVHLKDIFALITRGQDRPLKDMVRPLLFVPESVKVNQLLREFRQQHMHIAMVLDEHGSLIGLITLEDILEEIVGDISDEHDVEPEKIIQLKAGGWLVNASMPLEELEETLDIEFESEDSVTLGGFLSEQLQHLPKTGERMSYKGFSFQVQKANRKRVLQVLVFKETKATNKS